MNRSPVVAVPHHFFTLFALVVLASVLSACDGKTSLTSKSTSDNVQLAPIVTPAAGPEPEPVPEPVPMPAPPPEPPTLADITDLILVTGQSNALGAGTSFDAALDASDERVFAFTENGWQVASLRQVWDRGWFPRTNPNTDPANNFSLHFGKRVIERSPQRVVGFVLITAPGQAIKHWQPQGQFFNEIRNKVSWAISDLPNKSSVDGILWHQGESDGRDDHVYGDTLYDLISAFQNEPWFAPGRPFICGETASLPVNNQLQKLNRDNNPNTGCIAAEGLPTFPDGSHFNTESLRIIGRRYGDFYVDMTR